MWRVFVDLIRLYALSFSLSLLLSRVVGPANLLSIICSILHSFLLSFFRAFSIYFIFRFFDLDSVRPMSPYNLLTFTCSLLLSLFYSVKNILVKEYWISSLQIGALLLRIAFRTFSLPIWQRLYALHHTQQQQSCHLFVIFYKHTNERMNVSSFRTKSIDLLSIFSSCVLISTFFNLIIH